MARLLGRAALVAVIAASTANAGGVERSTQSIGILFEEGNYAQFTYSHVDPKVSGLSTTTYSYTGGTNTGDMSESFEQLTFGMKFDLSEKFDIAIVRDNPIGADVLYPSTAPAPFPFSTDHVFAGGNADLDSEALNLFLRYKLPNNFSVIGGIRHVNVGGNLGIPFFTNYTLDVADSSEIGFTGGLAWEMPEIAARVSLTYHSATDHTFDITENSIGAPDAFPTFSDFTNQMDVTIPQSVNLEFQTGVAADTLVFGSVRWVDWTEFNITPTGFGAVAGALVDYDDDAITYNLGVGRRLTDNWSVAATVGYEETQGGFTGNLGPTDGYTSLGLATTYTRGKMKITGGVSHLWIGNATTLGPPIEGFTEGDVLANFTDNSAWAWGLRVGYYF